MKKIHGFALWLGVAVFCLSFGCAPKPPITEVETDTGTVTSTTGLPPAARVVAPAGFEAYVGQYELQQADMGQVTISVENGKLLAQAGSMPRTELVPTTTDQFSVPNTDVQITFTREGQAEVTGLQVLYNGETYTGRKVQ